MHDQSLAVQSMLERIGAEAVKSSNAARAALPESASFVSDLPESLDAESVMRRVADLALVHAAALTDSRVERASPASGTELGRASVTFVLRGPYQAIKATMGEVLARTSNATLHSLTIRRDAKQDVEAQIVLSLWLRPSTAAGDRTK